MPGPGRRARPGDDRDLALDPAPTLDHVAPPRYAPGEEGGARLVPADVGHHRHLGARHLPLAGLAPQLAHRLGRVAERGVQPPARQLAAPGVERQLAAEVDAPAALDEAGRLADPAEAERLQPPHDLDREPVVELGDVDVARAQVGAVPQGGGGGVADPGHVLPLLPRRPAVDHAGHRLDAHRRPQVGRGLGGGHDDGRGPVDRHVAVVQAHRGRDHPCGQVVVDGERVAVHGVGVASGVVAAGRRGSRRAARGWRRTRAGSGWRRAPPGTPATASRPAAARRAGPRPPAWSTRRPGGRRRPGRRCPPSRCGRRPRGGPGRRRRPSPGRRTAGSSPRPGPGARSSAAGGRPGPRRGSRWRSRAGWRPRRRGTSPGRRRRRVRGRRRPPRRGRRRA